MGRESGDVTQVTTISPVVWVIAMMLTGTPVKMDIVGPFDTESGCRLYLHTAIHPDVQQAFRLECTAVTNTEQLIKP